VLSGEELHYEGKEFAAHVPPLAEEAETPRGAVPLYVAGTGPRMQELAGEVGDGLLTPSITTPAFVQYARENMARGAERAGRDPGQLDLGCTIVASIDVDRDRGRDGAREIAGMYLANKVQNIQASADTLLEKAELTMDEIRPIAEAMESGGRLAAARAVSDEVLDKSKPIAGTPDECIAAIEEYRDAGCTHIMLELWGEDRDEQIRLFGERVLPAVRSAVA
jgi:5,10-methylenetetrahydromethanopterin reductase